MKITLAVFILMFFSTLAYAEEALKKRTFATVIFENDAVFRDDGLYSNGIFVNWGYNHVDALDNQNLPNWIAYLAQKTYLVSDEKKQYTVSYGFGQQLQTAIDIDVEELVEEDAPYVALLAWEVNLSAYDDFVNDEIGLILGAVGPIAAGEFAQSAVHDLIGSSEPMGWDNQINNEPVFRAHARRTWRSYQTFFGENEFDFLTGVEGGIGNLRSDLSAGLGVRYGKNLAANFSSASVFPVQKFDGLQSSPYGWYLFLNTSVAYVANDIFMDGNTFQDSHSVDLLHLQAKVSAGTMLNISDFSVLFSLVYSTNEYHDQASHSRYGSIAVTYHF